MDPDQQIGGKEAPQPSARQLCREGNSLLEAGDLYGAREKFAQALFTESSAEAQHQLGLIELSLKNTERALDLLNAAANARPDTALYWNSLGRALWEAHRPFEARNAFHQALSRHKDFADAWANLALVLLSLDEPEHLVEGACLTALRLTPDNRLAQLVLADLRGLQGRARERAGLMERLAALKDEQQGEFLAKAGLSYAEAEEYAAASALLARSLLFYPDDGEFYKAYGESLGEAGRVRQAKTALVLGAGKANGKNLWRYRHLGYCPEYFESTAQQDDYWGWLQAELDAALAQRPVFDRELLARSGFAASFNITHLWRSPRPVLEKMAAFFEPSFAVERPDPTRRLQKTGRIRVGFVVSPRTAAGFVRVTGPLVRGLDPRRFERILFYPAEESAQFSSLAGPGGMGIAHSPYTGSFLDAARLVLNARCDIVYHWKAGETAWTLYMPLMRLAPVQCTSWGTHGTSGIRRVDYSVSWDLAELPVQSGQSGPSNQSNQSNQSGPSGQSGQSASDHYSEQLVRIATPPLIQPRPGNSPAVTKAELGLPSKGTLYFCPHRLPKYHPAFDSYLAAILENDPDAHILLLLYGRMPAREQVRQRLLHAVGERRARRLLFLPRCRADRFQAIMAACDIALASPAYDGSLTAYDAFSAGTPMVTQLGELLINRYTSASYWGMRIADAPIALDREGYVQAALELSRNPEKRHDLSLRLKKQSAMFADPEPIVDAWARFFEEVADVGQL